MNESDYAVQQVAIRRRRISILGDKNELDLLQHPDLKIKVNRTLSRRSDEISSNLNYLSICGKTCGQQLGLQKNQRSFIFTFFKLFFSSIKLSSGSFVP